MQLPDSALAVIAVRRSVISHTHRLGAEGRWIAAAHLSVPCLPVAAIILVFIVLCHGLQSASKGDLRAAIRSLQFAVSPNEERSNKDRVTERPKKRKRNHTTASSSKSTNTTHTSTTHTVQHSTAQHSTAQQPRQAHQRRDNHPLTHCVSVHVTAVRKTEQSALMDAPDSGSVDHRNISATHR